MYLKSKNGNYISRLERVNAFLLWEFSNCCFVKSQIHIIVLKFCACEESCTPVIITGRIPSDFASLSILRQKHIFHVPMRFFPDFFSSFVQKLE